MRKFQHQVETEVCTSCSREKSKSEGDYITYDGVDVASMTEIDVPSTILTSRKLSMNFDAVHSW